MRKKQVEFTRLLEPDRLPGVRLMHANYLTHSFGRHCHDGYAFGVIERGELCFRYLGAQCVAAPGMINLVCPGESHDGHGSNRQGWAYRMFYLSTACMHQITNHLSSRHTGLPFFRTGILHDNDLAGLLVGCHRSLFDDGTCTGTAEEDFYTLFTRLIAHHAEERYVLKGKDAAPALIKRLIEKIEDEYDQSLNLDSLADEAGLSKFHLIRIFSSATGLTPHRFINQVRVRHSERLLRQGTELVDIAHLTGFSDQSHFTRIFKSLVGLSPGKYRNFVQDSQTSFFL